MDATEGWPSGTKVVVYARKEDKDKALVLMLQKGYVVDKFVELAAIMADIMPKGKCLATPADELNKYLKQPHEIL